MNCPNCGKDNNIVYGGKDIDLGKYKRYSKCLSCGDRFTSIEIYVENPRQKIKLKKSSKNV
jgi:transcriptional regulator NrdR family protein